MIRTLLAALVLVFGSLVVGAQSPQGIARVAWLQGCWRMVSGAALVEEQWMAPRAGIMLGIGRTTRGDTLAEFEFVRIQERGNRLVYVAHPSGQPSAEFVSIEVDTSRVIFENVQHDFPQRVGYRRQGEALAAWIEGTASGQTRRVDFAYQPVSCAAN